MMVCIITVPEGINLRGCLSDLGIITGGINRELDADQYIRPVLGNLGDRFIRHLKC